MMRLALSIVLTFAVAGLTACSNAIYYYQSDRVSLTLETRPDPTQPVQGNLGIKQRIAVITPGLESVPIGSATEAVSGSSSSTGSTGSEELRPSSVSKEAPKGEALSMIGSFKFGKERGSGVDTGPVIIKSALISGDAATSLNPDETRAAAEALAARAIPTYDELAMRSIQIAEKKQKKDRLEKLTSKKFDELTADEKKELGKITDTLSNYDEELHKAIGKILRQGG